MSAATPGLARQENSKLGFRRWLAREVELSRCAASAFQHRSAYAILSQMAEAPISKSVVKQPLSGGIVSLRADAVASRWTLLVKYGNISAIFLKGF